MPAFAMAHAHFHQVQDDLRQPYPELRDALPEVFTAYNALHVAAYADGALSAKTKELIALPSPSPGSATDASPPTAAARHVGAPPPRRSPR